MIWRVTRRETFLALRKEGIKVRSGLVTMVFAPSETQHPQLAFALHRRFGNAVKRNRARRRLKEAFTLLDSQNSVKTGAYLISASPKVLQAPFKELIQQLSICLQKVENAT